MSRINRSCSRIGKNRDHNMFLALKGPGFMLNSHLDPSKYFLFGSTLAIRWPSGTTAIWAEIPVIDNGIRLYQKNWFMNDSMIQAPRPKTHILKVRTGNVGSSVFGTVNSTSSTAHRSNSSTPSSISMAAVEGFTVDPFTVAAIGKDRKAIFGLVMSIVGGVVNLI